MNDEFYVGWMDQAPPGHARLARRFALGALAVALALGVAFAQAQRLIGVAYFEWGRVQEFAGVLHADPYPHLVLHAGETGASGKAARLAAPLVAPFKFGVPRTDLEPFDGQAVALRATCIHRDGQLLLELEPGSIRPATLSVPIEIAEPVVVSLGRHVFQGEIVDSKCWMGVMNPGVLTPHRACAVRCISGGVPPMLLVRREGAIPLNLLLVSADDQPVNDQVLDLVAEPVEVTGEVVRQGQLLLLRSDPATYRRLAR